MLRNRKARWWLLAGGMLVLAAVADCGPGAAPPAEVVREAAAQALTVAAPARDAGRRWAALRLAATLARLPGTAVALPTCRTLALAGLADDQVAVRAEAVRLA